MGRGYDAPGPFHFHYRKTVMNRLDAAIILIKVLGLYCGIQGVAALAQALALATMNYPTLEPSIVAFAGPVIYLFASFLLIFGARAFAGWFIESSISN